MGHISGGRIIEGSGSRPFLLSGPPSGSTHAGIAAKGARLIDVLNGVLYINTGSQAAPQWDVVGAQGAPAIINPATLANLAGFWDLSALSGSPASVANNGGDMAVMAAGGAGNTPIVTVGGGKYLDFPDNGRWLTAAGFGTSGPFALHLPVILPVPASSNALVGSVGDLTRALYTAATDQPQVFNYPGSAVPGHLGTTAHLLSLYYKPDGGDPADGSKPGLVRIEVDGVPVVAAYGPGNLTSQDVWGLNIFNTGNGGRSQIGSVILRRAWESVVATGQIQAWFAANYPALSLTPPVTGDRYILLSDSIGRASETGNVGFLEDLASGSLSAWRLFNNAVAGSVIAGVANSADARFMTDVALQALPGGGKCKLGIFLGTNDMSIAGKTDAQAFAELQALIGRLQALGAVSGIDLYTMLPRTGLGGNDALVEGYRTNYNAAIRSTYGGVSGFNVIDFGSTTNAWGTTASTTDLSLYLDGTHPTAALQASLAAYAAAHGVAA